MINQYISLYKSTLLLFISLALFINCSRLANRSEHIVGVEEQYQQGKFANSLDVLRKLYKESEEKNRLLYLMEAGSILHAMEEWEKSNELFEEANEIAERLNKSMGEEILAFFVNEKEKTYVGEPFEHTKLKLYIALNYLMLDKKEKALRFLRALNQDLADIRDTGKNYQQNFAARYLGAILAEEQNDINYARVQYNNIKADSPFDDLAGQELLRLAILEKDSEDIKKYAKYKKLLHSYNREMQSTPITTKTKSKNLGSIVIIHQAGIAPYKAPKGKIKDDETFNAFFKGALGVAIATKGSHGIDESLLLYFVGEAVNPIPQFVSRENILVTQPAFHIANKSFSPTTLDDYQSTVFRNYNDEYPNYVRYNVGNIATRVLIVYLSSKALKAQSSNSKNKNNSALLDLFANMVTIVGGASISALLEPDLRSWSLTYNNLQMKRIFLEPGEYPLMVDKENYKYNYFSKLPEKINIEQGKTVYLLLKSF